MQLKARKLLLL